MSRRYPSPTVALLLAASLVAACRGRAAPGDRAASLLEADRAAGTLAEVLAEDVHYLAPDLPIVEGREAVRRELGASAPANRQPLIADVSSDGPQGYTAGRTVGPDAGHGKYLAYWRRDGDEWALWAIVVNGSPEAPDPPATQGKAPGEPVTGAGSTPGDLEAADSQFSARSAAVGVGPAFREFAEPSALTLMGPGHGMIWGDSAVGAYFAEAIPATDGLTWVPRIAHLAPSGELGFTIGDAVYRRAPAGGPEQRFYTKYLTVWRKQPDGRWRYAADGGNDQPAPADRSNLRVTRTPAGLRLVNPDTADAFFTVFEQRMTALVNWRPCVDGEGCRSVSQGSERVLPLDSVPGVDGQADSVTVFWWRRSLESDGATAFDSVRSRTVGLR